MLTPPWLKEGFRIARSKSIISKRKKFLLLIKRVNGNSQNMFTESFLPHFIGLIMKIFTTLLCILVCLIAFPAIYLFSTTPGIFTFNYDRNKRSNNFCKFGYTCGNFHCFSTILFNRLPQCMWWLLANQLIQLKNPGSGLVILFVEFCLTFKLFTKQWSTFNQCQN